MSDHPLGGDDQERIRRLSELLDDLVIERPILPACPRCAATSVAPMSSARATIEWLLCETCSHVWARGRTPPTRRVG
jgi:hypothetical protein